ncbi:MAG TPA: hypothetical protein VJ777_05465 [Mycobacterium sp.]|nr:hypothetical protein [Mycobacterium sp.]
MTSKASKEDRRSRQPNASGLIGAAVTLAGIAQLLLSYVVSGWTSDVLVNTGAASLLFVPLYLVQRNMEMSVRETRRSLENLSQEVQDSQAEVRQSLEELQGAFAARDFERSEERQRDVASIAEQPSCRSVRRALTAAIDDRVMSRKGVRVHVVDPRVYVFARLKPTPEGVNVVLEKRDGQSVAELDWTAEQTPADIMTEIADRLRAASLSPSNSFDPTLLFKELNETLTVAREVKDRYALIDDMASAQEYVPPQWIIYDWGIGASHEGLQPYYIDRQRLYDRDLTRHMSEKIWLDRNSFDEAVATARLLGNNGLLS